MCYAGPASNDVDKLVSLIGMGLCIARLNFSHGTHAVGNPSIPDP